MSGKTFQADKTPSRFRLSKTSIFLFVALVIAISVLQLGNNIILNNESKSATAAAIFFAESVEQMCEVDPGQTEPYQGLCREAREYSSGIDSIYDLSRDPRGVKSITCHEGGSIIEFIDGSEFESDRLCGDGPLFEDPAPKP